MRLPEALGAVPLGGERCRFRVWAPRAARVEVRLLGPPARAVALKPEGQGYHAAVVDGVAPGARYVYVLDGQRALPDPASRHQPEGVHGPSEVVDLRGFPWTDAAWHGPRLEDLVIYELHVGTFTAEGTFDAAVERLDDLADLGVTAVELMPVAEFPGGRNWGYDGVFPFAAQRTYGGPAGLQRLVDACHARGLAVLLDVVYNHLGPEGNVLAAYAPYFTDRYRTPWGEALNFDGAGSDEVRAYFVANALHWVEDLHVDGLRLDAVHAILDQAPRTFLEDVGEAVHARAAALGRRAHVIAESATNDPRLVRPPALGGYGLDGVWADDLHHALHALLTGERTGYYADYGTMAHLAQAWRRGFGYAGEVSVYRGHRHGAVPWGVTAPQFVVASQTHDQVGNRLLGDRLASLVPFEGLKLAAGVLLLSPFTPLLFMGEEHGETAPFPYFISHLDPALVEAVRKGRAAEFAAFRWQGEPPDPQAEATFQRAKVDWKRAGEEGPRALRALYRELLRLRREVPALAHRSLDHLEAHAREAPPLLVARRWVPPGVAAGAGADAGGGEVAAVFHLGRAPAQVEVPLPPGTWAPLLDSADARWRGPGASVASDLRSDGVARVRMAPLSFALLARQEAP